MPRSETGEMRGKDTRKSAENVAKPPSSIRENPHFCAQIATSPPNCRCRAFFRAELLTIFVIEGRSKGKQMKHAIIMAGAAALGLAFISSPARSTPVPAPVLACEGCTAIELPAQPASPADRKIKVTRVWSLGVLH